MASLGWSPGRGDWFAAAGIERPDWRRGARFSNAGRALSAAAEETAVALGRVSLAEPELRPGRLVAPPPPIIDPEAHHRFVCPDGAQARPALAAFPDWLREGSAATPDPAPQLQVVRVPRLPRRRAARAPAARRFPWRASALKSGAGARRRA